MGQNLAKKGNIWKVLDNTYKARDSLYQKLGNSSKDAFWVYTWVITIIQNKSPSFIFSLFSHALKLLWSPSVFKHPQTLSWYEPTGFSVSSSTGPPFPLYYVAYFFSWRRHNPSFLEIEYPNSKWMQKQGCEHSHY